MSVALLALATPTIHGCFLAPSAAPDLRIVATSQVDGQLVGCPCGDGSVAGFGKLSSAIRHALNAPDSGATTPIAIGSDVSTARIGTDGHLLHGIPTILVDTGNFLSPSEDSELDEAMLKSASELGYSAIALGDQEFADGFGALRRLSARYPLGSHNVRFQTDEHKWIQPLAVPAEHRLGTTSILVIALTSPRTFDRYPEAFRSRVVVTDPAGYIESVSPFGADTIVVVVFHGDREESLLLAEEVPRVDVIVFGRWSEETVERSPSGPWLVSAGSGGNVALTVDLKRDRAGEWHPTVNRIEANYYRDPDEDVVAGLWDDIACQER